MLKRRIVFGLNDTDKRLLASSIAALESDVLKARYEYTTECDETGRVTLFFWQRRTGGFDAK